MLSPNHTKQPLKLQSNKDHRKWFSHISCTATADRVFTKLSIFLRWYQSLVRLLLLATNMLLVSDMKHLQLAPDTGSSPKHLSPIIPQKLPHLHAANWKSEETTGKQKTKSTDKTTISTYIIKSPYYLSRNVSYEHVQSNAAFKCGQKYQKHKHRSEKLKMSELTLT